MRTKLRHRLRALLRLTAVLLLVSLGATIPANVALAFSEICCDDCEQEQGDCPEGDCECPLGCTTCCAGSVVRAVAPAPAVTLDVPVRRTDSLRFEATLAPPQGISREVLHVPKLAV